MSSTPLQTPRERELPLLNTQQLREAFLLAGLFAPGQLAYRLTDLDRMAVGGAVPLGAPLLLPADRETGTGYFLERRELGALNLGGPGRVRADSQTFDLGHLDCVYLGAGVKSVAFESRDRAQPAKFYWLSCPAHASLPAAVLRRADIQPVAVGAPATANVRKIYKYIHAAGLKSCQLVMGLTELAEGSVWNTMPPHTHTRRMEVYLYFNLGEQVVSHFLGSPRETRHLFVHNEQAVLSPPWSIHAGCGTGNYKFIWGMAGENIAYDDMDPAPIPTLR